MDIRQLDEILGEISRDHSYAADSILDLREAVMERRDAGKCVRCYFSIFSNVGDHGMDPLARLRCWIERHLRIVAQDSSRNVLEHMPVRLDGESLEAYCHRVMSEIHMDRAYDADGITLNFDYMAAA